jgi:type IV conjugative transfer system protein TraL
MEKHYIPKYLSSQPQFLWWDADEALILVLGLLIGVAFDQRLICIGTALIIQKVYAKTKEHSQIGFLHHKLYAIGLKKFRKIPPYYIKLFIR